MFVKSSFSHDFRGLILGLFQDETQKIATKQQTKNTTTIKTKKVGKFLKLPCYVFVYVCVMLLSEKHRKGSPKQIREK